MDLEKKNITIVGAGIIGISSALYLIRRSCKITLIDNESLRCNDSSIVKFTFKFHPEFIEKKM